MLLLLQVLLLCAIHYGNSQTTAESSMLCPSMDVVFLIDGVSNIGNTTLEEEKTLVKNLLSLVPISEEYNHVAIFSYDEKVKKIFKLKQNQSDTAAIAAVDSIVLGSSNQRNTHKALNKACKYLRKHGRDGVEDIIIYITAGPADNLVKALQVAERIWNKGTTLFTIGVGAAANSTEVYQLGYPMTFEEPADVFQSCEWQPAPTSAYDGNDEDTRDASVDYSASIVPTSSYHDHSDSYYSDCGDSDYPSSSFQGEFYWSSSSYDFDDSESYWSTDSYDDSGEYFRRRRDNSEDFGTYSSPCSDVESTPWF